jgi:polar amino acid transport system ATP-binding protein
VTTTDPLLAVRQVHKAFGENAVLRGIDVDVERHTVVTLIGASGSGKSTLLRCINGLVPVDAGTILLEGADITAADVDLDAVRTSIGMVFQSFNLFPHMSVLENVTLAPRKVRGTKVAEARARGLDLLERFGLSAKADDYPDRLSGGQQQRVAIVRALAMDPELMLFDEVTSALDPELVGEVLDVIRGLKGSGMTIVMATHEMGFAREVSDRVCFLDGGRVLEAAPPAQLFGDPSHDRTRAFLARVLA